MFKSETNHKSEFVDGYFIEKFVSLLNVKYHILYSISPGKKYLHNAGSSSGGDHVSFTYFLFIQYSQVGKTTQPVKWKPMETLHFLQEFQLYNYSEYVNWSGMPVFY